MVLLALSWMVDHSKEIASENQTGSYGMMLIKGLKAAFLSPPSCFFLIATLSKVTSMLLWFQKLQSHLFAFISSDAVMGLFFLGINLGEIFVAEISSFLIKKLRPTFGWESHLIFF